MKETIERIAREMHIGIETPRGQGPRPAGLLHFDIAVWTLREALEKAYRAGYDAGIEAITNKLFKSFGE